MELTISRNRQNNFDLLRLFAAIQVAAWHCYAHLHLPAALNRIIYGTRYFPGIPVFFAISGFLVFASYRDYPDVHNYARNRFLRIFPGLWLCLLVTVAALATLGYINRYNIFSRQLWLWLLSQTSFFQFYTPAIFRMFGVGNPNGALWTIPVEIDFYIFVPILFLLANRIKIGRNAWILIWMALSVAYNIWYQPYKFSDQRSDFIKLLGVTPAPYLFYFLLGAVASNNWERISKWYEGKGWFWFAAYCVYCLVFSYWLKKFEPGYWTGFYHFFSMALLSQAVIALAYTHKQLSASLLRHNDYSYGIYIYHMPVINVVLALAFIQTGYNFLIVGVCTALLAWISWKYVERPALAMKRRTAAAVIDF